MGSVADGPTPPNRHPRASLDLLRTLTVDALVGFVFADVLPLPGSIGLVDWHLCGLVDEALSTGRFVAKRGERLLCPTFGRLAAKQLIVFGLGGLTDPPVMDLRAEPFGLGPVLAQLGCRRAGVLLPSLGLSAQAHKQPQADRWAKGIELALQPPAGPLEWATFLAAPMADR